MPPVRQRSNINTRAITASPLSHFSKGVPPHLILHEAPACLSSLTVSSYFLRGFMPVDPPFVLTLCPEHLQLPLRAFVPALPRFMPAHAASRCSLLPALALSVSTQDPSASCVLPKHLAPACHVDAFVAPAGWSGLAVGVAFTARQHARWLCLSMYRSLNAGMQHHQASEKTASLGPFIAAWWRCVHNGSRLSCRHASRGACDQSAAESSAGSPESLRAKPSCPPRRAAATASRPAGTWLGGPQGGGWRYADHLPHTRRTRGAALMRQR